MNKVIIPTNYEIEKLKFKTLSNFDNYQSGFTLFEGKAILLLDNNEYECIGSVTVEFRPSMKITFQSQSHFDTSLVERPLYEDINCKVIIQGNEHKGEITKYNESGGIVRYIKIVCEKDCLNKFPYKDIRSIIFHLFNVPSIGNRTGVWRKDPCVHVLKICDFRIGNISTRIIEAPIHHKVLKKVKENGGISLTHTGYITFDKGYCISSKRLHRILDMYKYFLSFVIGDWCIPSYIQGFNNADEKIWHSWQTPEKEWETRFSIMGDNRYNLTEDFFPFFAEKCKNKILRNILYEIITLYVYANTSPDYNSGIVLAQAALEKLAYKYCIEYKECVSVHQLGHRASDKIYTLLTILNIPVSQTENLNNIQSILSFYSSPLHLITDIRNSLTHSISKHKELSLDQLYEVWTLMMWYCETCILAICEYEGIYLNRLKIGHYDKLEYVPWSQNSGK